jgi:hypothetical protein
MRVDEVPTPTLDKMKRIHEASQVCGRLLEWLHAEKGVTLAVEHRHRAPDEVEGDPEGCRGGARYYQCGLTDGELVPARLGGIEKILAEFFDIDLAAVDREKRALLQAVRAAHAR